VGARETLVPQISPLAGRGSRSHSRSVAPAGIPICRRVERRAGKTSRGRARPAEEEGRTVGTTVPRGYSSESRRLRTRVVRKYRAVDRFFKAIESDFEVGSDLEVESDLQHPPHTLVLKFGGEERFSGHQIDHFLLAGPRERSRKRLLHRVSRKAILYSTKATSRLRDLLRPGFGLGRAPEDVQYRRSMEFAAVARACAFRVQSLRDSAAADTARM
jgi:hypothetical protein